MRFLLAVLALASAVFAAVPVTPTSESADAKVCTSYCNTIGVCTAAPVQQYPSTSQCNSYCLQGIVYEQPSTNPSLSDTLTCRNYHAGLAAAPNASLTTHCPHAGPSGGGVCGSNCQAYCGAMNAFCGGANLNSQDNILTYSTCMSLCGDLPVDSQKYSTSVTGSDSIMCRLYHVANNAINIPNTHCPHASLSGGSVCGSYCQSYCRMVNSYCGSQTGFPSTISGNSTCLSWCNTNYATKTGKVGDTTGDTINCRIHYAGAAKAAASVNCPMAYPVSSTCASVPSTVTVVPPPTHVTPPPSTASSVIFSVGLVVVMVAAALF